MPRWIGQMLKWAAVYNLVWGASVILFPLWIFNLAGMEAPRYPGIWQCVGMIVGVYGVGYWIAASAPARHYPIVLVGFLGKIFGPIGFVAAAIGGDLPWSWGWTILTNDLIWWFPFAMALYYAFRANSDTSRGEVLPFTDAIEGAVSQRGTTLQQLAIDAPLLTVFLRHSGCTFCREALSDLRDAMPKLKELGVNLAVVHMSPPMEATLMMQKHRLESVHHFCDPHCDLYRAFGLARGKLNQLFAPRIWWRGFQAGIMNQHGLGALSGDGFRMPGLFVVHQGRLLAESKLAAADERPDYVDFVRNALDSQPAAPADLVAAH